MSGFTHELIFWERNDMKKDKLAMALAKVIAGTAILLFKQAGRAAPSQVEEANNQTL